MWAELEPHWGPARDVRPDQPLMAIETAPLVEPDPLVRPVAMEELDILLPACVAMFTEEVGVSPVTADGGASYRARVAELIARRAFVRPHRGRQGRLQGRDRLGDRRRLPGAGRLGRRPSCAAAGCQRRGMAAVAAQACATSRRS